MKGLTNLDQIVDRALKSLRAALIGWLLAVALTFPMQMIRIHENLGGNIRVYSVELLQGAIVWVVWTMSFAGLGWLLCCLPIVTFVPEEWLVRNSKQTIRLAGAAGLVMVLVEFRIWDIFRAESYMDWWLLGVYCLYFVVFAVFTAFVYLRLLSKRPA